MDENLKDNQIETPDATEISTPDVEQTTAGDDESIGYTYVDESTEKNAVNSPLLKKPKNVRVWLEIAGGILLLILLFSSGGKVSKETFTSLEKSHKEQTTELKEIKTSFEQLSAEYSGYKTKMSKFDGLSDEEQNALIAEVDRITAEKKAKDDEAAKAAADAAAADAAKQQAAAQASTEQKNALRKAGDYLSFSAFSHSGLIEQLKYEGYSAESATYAADNCGADWNVQAEKKAKDYMSFSSFSHSGLVEQLVYEGFTQEQAEHGASAAGY